MRSPAGWRLQKQSEPNDSAKLGACEMLLCSALKGQHADFRPSKGRWKMYLNTAQVFTPSGTDPESMWPVLFCKVVSKEKHCTGDVHPPFWKSTEYQNPQLMKLNYGKCLLYIYMWFIYYQIFLDFFFFKKAAPVTWSSIIKVNSLKNCQKNLYCCISFKAGIKK